MNHRVIYIPIDGGRCIANRYNADGDLIRSTVYDASGIINGYDIEYTIWDDETPDETN